LSCINTIFLPAYNSLKNIFKNPSIFSRFMITNVLPPFYGSQCISIYLQSFPSRPNSSLKSKNSPFYYILASPVYAPGTIAVNVTLLKRGFNACKTPRCIYPSIFNRFPVIQAGSLKIRHFSTFFAHFGLSCIRPSDNRGKCYIWI